MYSFFHFYQLFIRITLLYVYTRIKVFFQSKNKWGSIALFINNNLSFATYTIFSDAMDGSINIKYHIITLEKQYNWYKKKIVMLLTWKTKGMKTNKI